MKKILMAAALLLSTTAAFAQLLTVESMQHVALPQGYRADQVNVSPDGSYAVLSTAADASLTKVDLTTGATRILSDNGSNVDLQFNADGSKVVFRQITLDSDHRRYASVKSVDVATGRSTTVAGPSRNLQAIAVEGQVASTVDNGRARMRSLNGGALASARPVLSIDRGQLCITRNGKTEIFSPAGRQGKSYIWPSLSPDGTKVAFVLVGEGCYVCNIDGSGLKSLGVLRAPVWYGNDILVGMVNETDGYVNTASRLEAVAVDGAVRQTLTEPSLIATFPSAAKGKIAFSTPEGEVYILNVK